MIVGIERFTVGVFEALGEFDDGNGTGFEFSCMARSFDKEHLFVKIVWWDRVGAGFDGFLACNDFSGDRPLNVDTCIGFFSHDG